MHKQTDETKLALIQQDVGYIKDTIQRLDSNLMQNYVTKDALELVKKDIRYLKSIVYFVGAGFGSAVITYIANLLLNKTK